MLIHSFPLFLLRCCDWPRNWAGTDVFVWKWVFTGFFFSFFFGWEELGVRPPFRFECCFRFSFRVSRSHLKWKVSASRCAAVDGPTDEHLIFSSFFLYIFYFTMFLSIYFLFLVYTRLAYFFHSFSSNNGRRDFDRCLPFKRLMNSPSYRVFFIIILPDLLCLLFFFLYFKCPPGHNIAVSAVPQIEIGRSRDLESDFF